MTIIDPVKIPRTGDDTPATGLWRYVWRMTGWRQIGLCALALVAAALNLAPIELQRRIVDDAITPGAMEQLWGLGAAYVAVALAHQTVKFLLHVGQEWLSESAILYTRRHLMGLYDAGRAGRDSTPGEAVEIIGAEVEKLGGFVGTAPSTAFTDAALMLGVVGYMLWVDPEVAALGLALILPQVVLAPFMQRRINRLVQRQVALARGFGGAVATLQDNDGQGDDADSLAYRLFLNRMAIAFWKQALKAGLNLLNNAAPLALLVVGGAMAIRGETSVGVIVAFLSGFQRISEPIRNLIAFYRQAAQASVQHGMIARWM
jgi:ABC-type bacteriocin/lantibiotic exporter with double-glycine peptidase domain